MREIKLSLRAGEHIDRASKTASRLARKNNCRVRFDFNGVWLLATPKKSPVTIGWEYERITSQHVGRERARKEAEIKSAQIAVDHWMQILADMLGSGLDNTIGWLSNFLPACSVGVKVNRAMLIGMFEAHGYKAGECAGREKAFYEVKENLGRYIIGQVLDMWKRGKAVHHRICVFCSDYEALRRSQKN